MNAHSRLLHGILFPYNVLNDGFRFLNNRCANFGCGKKILHLQTLNSKKTLAFFRKIKLFIISTTTISLQLKFYIILIYWNFSYQISTFSEQGSFRMTSGAIHATVPANDILVLFSFHSRLVPKSDILTTSFLDINTLQQNKLNFNIQSKLL